jgi:2,4-diaminopentanoate dehydrogenase
MAYRVVQWATGSVGVWSLRQIIDDPSLELAGVWVSGPAKHGIDAGELCGRPSTGVLATSSKDAIMELDADAVVHAPAGAAVGEALDFDDDVRRLLASGKDVISTVSYYSPIIEGPERMTMLQAACEEGGSTLYGGGLDPGFVCDRVAALLTGSVAQVEQIRMIETLDISRHHSAALMQGVGFGKRPEELALDAPEVQYFAQRLFPGAVAKLADMLGIRLDEVRLNGEIEFALASEDLELEWGRIERGGLSGMRYEYAGLRDGEPFITHQWVHFAHRADVPDGWLMPPEPEPGEAMPYLVTVEIDGRPSLRTELLYTDAEDTVWLPTAATCIRAIPDVCSAPPGFLQEHVFGSWSGR